MNIPLITLYGKDYYEKDWVIPCIKSWNNILNIDRSRKYVIPDGSLTTQEMELLTRLELKVLGDETNSFIEDFLAKYPNLTQIRSRVFLWKKILDTIIPFLHEERVAIIDTDVFIKGKVLLPETDFDISYMRDDTPGYSGKWNIAIKEKMVPALNSGLVIVSPKSIDFDYLEYLVGKYLIKSKVPWWTEQTAWACVAGKMNKRLLYNGTQVKMISCLRKRNAAEINNNSYKYLGKNGMLTDYRQFEKLMEGGSIIHFAGPGKTMFKKSLNYLTADTSADPIVIDGTLEETLSALDKVAISLRLYIKEWT